MAAIPPPLRSATRSDWITSRARPTACRSHGWPRRKAHSARPSPARREFPRHSGARAARASPESITTIGSMDSGPAPQVGNCRPKARPGMTKKPEFLDRQVAPDQRHEENREIDRKADAPQDRAKRGPIAEIGEDIG